MMTTFDDRYKNLNEEQRQAVDLVDGPLLVVAGPGTGKTELLSMRVANILKKTDTLPENILCLTFTESGATAMRSRLSDIIGPQAYKVAIQTFHSFGTEIINQNREYFYRGAEFQPADDIASYDILTNIFDELDYNNPLASKNNGEYVHLSDTLKAIGELKQAGLSSDELIAVLDANDRTLDAIEQDLADIFANRPSVSMLSMLVPIAEKAASLPAEILPSAITPLANELALSMARAFDEAVEINKTTPITAWRDEWLEKDTSGRFVFKDRKRHAKLRALAQVYFSYISRMEQASLYDYNDMILNVVHAMELHTDLKANLQEKYQYILVDEFQDTNLAQLRILFNLTDNPLGDEPNVMAVGDDDQAIYSFQGADVNNINRFREQFPSYRSIVLTHNYRSSELILQAAREVIKQADGRLETIMDINKTLTPHADASRAKVSRTKLPTRIDENDWVASTIAAEIKSGVKPSDIAVLARNHDELIALVPYLHHYNVAVDYERRDNILDKESILALELLAETAVAIFGGDHDLADSKLPELLSHPMFQIPAETIWRVSLQAHRSGLTWLETMLNTPDLRQLAEWLIARAQAVPHETLEVFVDTLIGAPSEKTEGFISPYHQYYFGTPILNDSPEDYLTTLEALRTLRTKLREYRPNDTLHIADMLEFTRMHRELGARIMTIRSGVTNSDAVHLMTSHKSKGLEFDTVFIINSMDGRWGERVRSRSSLINYPENLRIRPNSNSYNERLRLYFVAMTRAKRQLFISYSATDASGKDILPAGFLSGIAIDEQVITPGHDIEALTTLNQLDWQDYVTNQPTATMKALLEPTLENYKLSATHLNNFIDLTHGGPSMFLMNNLLRFPAAKSASASYGTAIHATLQRAHNHLVATGEKRPVEDILGDFIHELEREHLNEADFEFYSKKGSESLATFLAVKYSTFALNQRTELNFANQGVFIGEAHLTGSLDLVDFEESTITVTDYKTGRPSNSWKGTTDYDKIRLHKYRQQLMFYQLLCENSRNYASYSFEGGVLQFVEPDARGEIHALEESFTHEDLERFSKLIKAVWHCIVNLDFPDVSEYDASYKGIIAFEDALIDKYD